MFKQPSKLDSRLHLLPTTSTPGAIAKGKVGFLGHSWVPPCKQPPYLSALFALPDNGITPQL
jgi:hypothetical protein